MKEVLCAILVGLSIWFQICLCAHFINFVWSREGFGCLERLRKLIGLR